jgi:hypothetical protein
VWRIHAPLSIYTPRKQDKTDGKSRRRLKDQRCGGGGGGAPRRPDWTQSSVDYVREVAERQLCTAKCVFYRAEPEFLLQGGMPAVIKPNQKTTPGPMMVQGMVGWAGELLATY